MKKFDFRRQLKNMSLQDLKALRDKHSDYMINAMLFDETDADRQFRYIGYIDVAIKKIKNLNNYK
tara:strand:+ start:14678 stop:14872 length:195 start_codon:yes stop_codon:yes gene_type:complete